MTHLKMLIFNLGSRVSSSAMIFMVHYKTSLLFKFIAVSKGQFLMGKLTRLKIQV